MHRKFLAALAALTVLAGPALAQDAEEPNGWTGEGSVSAGMTTGNTETTDVGIGVNMAKDTGTWTYGVEAIADYGEIEGAEAKNRWLLAGTVDRQINDRLFGFGRASYEQDEFSGFESRAFIGGGLGYDVIVGEKQSWTVRGGPGLKIDEIAEIISTDALGATVVTPAVTEESLGVVGTSNYAYAFNDNVKFTNDTTVIYADVSTQLTNSLALTAALSDALSARISFDVRHDTEPPLGFEQTDTATRVSLVYGF